MWQIKMVEAETFGIRKMIFVTRKIKGRQSEIPWIRGHFDGLLMLR